MTGGGGGGPAAGGPQPDPVKELLFSRIGDSGTIPALVAQGRFDAVVRDVTDRCYDEISSMGEDRARAVGVMATGLLHYLLTRSMTASQRKVRYRGVDVDVVIPDLATLRRDPRRALLICIPMSSDPEEIAGAVSGLDAIQPVRANIWVVLSGAGGGGGGGGGGGTYRMPDGTVVRSFVLSRERNTFASIMSEIIRFAGGAGAASNLRIAGHL